MADNTGSLTPEEVAYFESEGATPLPGIQEDDHVEEEGLQAEAEGLEQQEEPAGEKPRDEKTGRFVPHQALHEEREKRKAVEREVGELKAFKAVMEDRWKTLLTATAKPEAKPVDADPEPDPNVDIFAHNQWLARQLTKQRDSIAAKEKAEQDARQAHASESAVWNDWHRSAQTYMEKTPDFGDAVKFLSDRRDKDLQALSFANPTLRDPQGRVQQINAELKSIIQAAKQQGIDPAEAVYQLAQGWGYTKTAGNQASPQTVPQMPEKLASVAKAQEASKTLGQVSGRSGGDAMSIDSLSKMGQADFNAWMASPGNEAVFRKLMGG